MPGRKRLRFVRDDKELLAFRQRLKLYHCPHCGHVGALVQHGFLRGYSDQSNERVTRGRRFFCSNRHRRTGCGRTFSVLFSAFLRGFLVSTMLLFGLVVSVLGGMTRYQAARAHLSTFCLRSTYRLWHRFEHAQAALRTRLCSAAVPPVSESRDPRAQLLAHFRAVFPGPGCPFSSFQERFQVHLLA